MVDSYVIMILHLILGFFIYIEQNNIQKFTPDGKFHKPEHVAVDKKDGVYVVVDDRGNARMQVSSPCQ